MLLVMKVYKDHYFLKAKQENYPARSVYKLQELDKRFSVFRKGMRVLDLGACPGSWCLGAGERVGPSGFVLGADIQNTETVFPPHIIFMQEDVFNRSSEFEAALQKYGPFHVLMSDMAPNTTGNKITDQTRSLELCEEAFRVACQHLQKGGTFIIKIFMGPDVKGFTDSLRPYFRLLKSFKPKSSRAESKETFYIGMGFTGIEGK